MTNPPHTADEAGGESIFISDGLPALIAPLPPPPLNKDDGRQNQNHNHHHENENQNDDDDDDDDCALIVPKEEEWGPSIAFRAFAHHLPVNAGWFLDRPAAKEDIDDDDGRDPRHRRLLQLKAEIDQLEATFHDNTNNNSQNDDDDDHHLKTMLLELHSRIDALNRTHSSSLTMQRHGYLSRIIQKTKTSSSSPPNIYLAASHNSENSSIQSNTTTLVEERLRKLENIVGNNNGCGNKSILERVEEVERLARETDAKQLEKLAAKAKVIRADLEAAARAKAKIGSSSSGGASAIRSSSSLATITTTTAEEDSEIIAALHRQLVELNDMSTHLPALTARLLELSNLHTNAAEFSSRLTDAELAVDRSEQMITNVEEALIKMEDGWKENLDVLERNVKKLDDMMSVLRGREGA